MTDWAADLVFTAVVLLVSVLVAKGGAARAGVRLVSVIFAGLLAMNYFEPLAQLLIRAANDATIAERFGRVGCLVAVFALAVAVLRTVTNRLLPEPTELPPILESVARWALGVLTGCVTAAVLLTAVHTFPGPADFWGTFPPLPEQRAGPIMKTAPDYQWLGFTQHVSEHVFRSGEQGRVFDGPRLKIGNVDKDKRWASFPLRYAAWRQKLETESNPRE